MITFLKYAWKTFTVIVFIVLAICFPHGWIILAIFLLAEIFSRTAKSSYEEKEYPKLKFRPIPQSRPNLYVVRRSN